MVNFMGSNRHTWRKCKRISKDCCRQNQVFNVLYDDGKVLVQKDISLTPEYAFYNKNAEAITGGVLRKSLGHLLGSKKGF